MRLMRPADYLVLALGLGAVSGTGVVLAGLADIDWLRALALLGVVAAGALLVSAASGFGVAAGLRQYDDERRAAQDVPDAQDGPRP